MSTKHFRPFASLVLVLALALAGTFPALAAPPTNDYFGSAEVVSSLPLNAVVDISEATTEEGEPQVCWFMPNTVWYSFTPAETMTVRASTIGSSVSANVNVYRSAGSGIGSLNFLGCSYFSSPWAFIAEAGQTYYLQAGPIFGEFGNIQVNLEQFTPPPAQANFHYSPFDPSINDTISFCDGSYDPAGFGFQSMTWDFGDGRTSTDNCAQNKYAADGDYTVLHSVTTFDGRSASTSQVVSVRTRDVSIMKVSAPKSANVGQTRAITVAIKNHRYDEMVRIELYRSVAGGWFEFVGSSTQYVPVRPGNRTSDFTFNYTFSPQDAQLGKVTFRVVVYLLNGRDAFPADNEAFSIPATVIR